ncbi:MAG: hypothetical protein JNN07_00745 [Verrucomicrobiales bacterium]|nr:hypothetical protein [Verrucomicrobiales bacterium]
MKWLPIILNSIAAVIFIFLGATAGSIHRVHSYSTYREFISFGVVDEQRLKTIDPLPSAPAGSHYDMPKRMQDIGNAEFWFSFIAGLSALACLLNAVVWGFRSRGPQVHRTS